MRLTPPRISSPHLNALRAFEAAARHENFALAAAELGVTAGAVSQQVRNLEDWVGAPLFSRQAQGVRLTERGRSLFPVFGEAFDALDRAVRALRSTRPAREVRIAALPSVAQLWLPPVLAMLRNDLDLIVSVTAMDTPPKLTRELFDLAIFIREPGDTASEIILAEDRIYPVCAPALARRIKHPEDLAHAPLLTDQMWEGDWDLWFVRTGVRAPDHSQAPSYSLYGLAIAEAKAGAGVLIGHDCLIRRDLDEGSLVRLFDADCATGKALILETAPDAGQPHIRAAIDLLLRQAD